MKFYHQLPQKKIGKGGYMVLRPDSGDQITVILMALRAAEKVFGCTKNKKGYKVINGCGVIQGDSVTLASLEAILKATKEAGYSAANLAFGMGGGLLQKLNRDTMSFATKLSHITYADGTQRDMMKTPKADIGKFSLPGEFVVKRNAEGIPITYPKESFPENDPGNLLQVVYDHGKVSKWDDFNTIRKRVAVEWPLLPLKYDNISPALKLKIDKFISTQST
jgi:nicotinamide phosphoribosyltransferase